MSRVVAEPGGVALQGACIMPATKVLAKKNSKAVGATNRDSAGKPTTVQRLLIDKLTMSREEMLVEVIKIRGVRETLCDAIDGLACKAENDTDNPNWELEYTRWSWLREWASGLA